MTQQRVNGSYKQAKARKAALRLQRERANPTVTKRYIEPDPQPRKKRAVEPTSLSDEQIAWRDSLSLAPRTQPQKPIPKRGLDARERRRKPNKRREPPTGAQLSRFHQLNNALGQPFKTPQSSHAASSAITRLISQIEKDRPKQ